MLTIQIKNGNNEVIAVVNDIFSLQVDDEVNKWWKLKLRFPTEKRLQKRPVQKADRISVSYGLKIWKTIRLFEWYITDITLQTNEVMIEADNWLSYLQRRMIRSAKTYTSAPINQVISEIFTELNNNKELPVVLGLNDCTTQISKEFDTGTSFYDILKYCREAEPKLVVRVINEWAYNFLECSENGWNVLDWVREYDARNTRGWNIVDWKWKDSMDDFYSFIQNAWGSITNEEFLQRTNLLFENYEEEGALSLPSWIAIPSVSVSRDTDWWDFNIWDRKNIRIITGYDWLPLSYLWLIQSRKVVIDANGWIKAEIKISEDYKADTNILDLVLQNLRWRKGKWSGGDMSDYYTKSETVSIVTTAVSWKADAVHSHLASDITNFAQAVSNIVTTALANYVTDSDLNTALSNYYTKTDVDSALSWKANATHSHAISDVSGLEDELDDKADAEHTHQIEDVDGLETALNWKSDTWHTHQTSDISWLDTALNNKADKNNTYTKTETDNLLSGKANSSHTHSMNDINWLSEELESKADLTDIPTVNDSTITIQINWNTLKSITLNQANGETINIPIPTKVSDLTNDSGFITKAVNDLTNYYTKSQTYTKSEVDWMISNFWWFEVVATLPTQNIKTNVIYLKWPIGSGADRYEEYIYYSNTWTLIGETSVDLTNYIDKNTPFITINGVAYKFWDSLTTPNTEYDTMTQAQATAWTGTTGLLITPKVLKDTIANMISWKADKSQIKAFVITESMVTVTTDATKWVSPYNTSYWYTNITINDNAGVEWVEGALYIFVINTSMVVASAYRNVRIRIGTWDYIPLMNSWNSILAWSSYFTKWRTDLYVYKSTYQSGWALHMNNDTSYSAMSVAEGTTGTATSSRVMRADYLKQIIQYFLQNVATPTADAHATNKKYVDDINTAIQQVLNGKQATLTAGNNIQIQTVNGVLTISATDTTYQAMTATEIATGTGTTARLISPANLKLAIETRCTEPGNWTINFSYNDEIIWYFTTNQDTNKTIVIPTGTSNNVTEQFVRSMIYAGVGDYDNVFRATSWLYKILNALDENDNLGLTEWEVWEDIVASQTSMSKISHSYSAMVCIASSKVAMDEILASATATNEMSECWNSIVVIAESELASDLYLWSANWISALFTYSTAQDAFFADPTKKQEIVNQYIMTIVNNNTLLGNLYTDSVVANAIINSQEAMNAIASSSTKLWIVDDSSTIMTAIATNSTALWNMSDSDFSTYILENSTYLTTTTSSTAWQNRINSMDADDLLPAIFYWTGLSWYSTFADLANSDSAMEIVQSDSHAMAIINCNEEALAYFDYSPNADTLVYLPLEWDLTDKTWKTTPVWNSITFETQWWKLWVRFAWNTNSYINLSWVQSLDTTDFTISFWIYVIWNSDIIFVHRWNSDSTNMDLHFIRRSTNKVDLWFYSNDCAWNVAVSNWRWYNLTWTYNHSTRAMRTYVNWALDWSRTWSWNPNFWTYDIQLWCKRWRTTWNAVNGVMSRFILEKREWSSSEVAEYVNKFKDEYWIS